MGKLFEQLTPAHVAFALKQQMFFVATAAPESRVNLSPKGLNSFRVLAPDRVGYLDLTGSGNETAAHLKHDGRITFMFCAFEGDPLILRLYGRGRVVRPRHSEWQQLRPLFGPPSEGERQLIIADIDSVQTSCGFAVPQFDFKAQRTALTEWTHRKGPEGIAAYWTQKNTRSLDGLPTGLLE